jgi:hypothetical protein
VDDTLIPFASLEERRNKFELEKDVPDIKNRDPDLFRPVLPQF